MKTKGTIIGVLGLLACLAGWLANCADGQPDTQRGTRTKDVAPPQPPGASTQAAKSNPSKSDPAPNKEEADLIRMYQQKYASKPVVSPPAPAPSNPVQTGGSNPEAPAAAKSPPAAASRPTVPPLIIDEHEGTPRAVPGQDANLSQSNDNPTGRQEPAVSLEWIGPP